MKTSYQLLRQSRQIATTLGFLVALVVLCSSTVALAATPEAVVQERTEAVAKVLAEPESPTRTARLAQEIDQTIDFNYLAARAFGEHWEVRTREEQEEFLTLLRRLLQQNYSDRFQGRQLGQDYRIAYEEARVRGRRAFVRAEITYRDRREAVIYRLHRDGNQWRIYDFVVDDISLEETYRDGYVPIIEEDGWEELIDLMKERLKEMEGR